MIINCRNDFPSLSREVGGRPVIYLDGPGGTQVPEGVIEAISKYYRTSNANSHGYFHSARETDEVIHQGRANMAAFIGAEGPHTISIGQNMTSLNFSLSHAIGRQSSPGDQVVITQLDHEANRGPWLGLSQYGIEIEEVTLLQDGKLDYDDFASKITSKTKVVAIGWASNALGTVNQVKEVIEMAHNVGALTVVDAVHYAPHFPINVQELGCDFLLCSSYKFYGPHLGFLYSKPGLLDQFEPDRLITQEQEAPFKIETGTLNHAAIAGASAAVEYMADFGVGEDLTTRIRDAKNKIQQQERAIGKRLFDGLAGIPGIKIHGLPFGDYLRAPTLSFTIDGLTPDAICSFLAEKGICCWDGHFYAIRAIEVLGLQPLGGVTRMGISVYNTEEEIDFTVAAVEQLVLEKHRTVDSLG